MDEMNIWTELLVEGFKEDPGLKAQIAQIEQPWKYFGLQLQAEMMAYKKCGLLHTYGLGEGLLMGYSSDDLRDKTFIKSIQESNQMVLNQIPEAILMQMGQNVAPVAAITEANWYEKYISNQAFFVIQVVVVKENLRGTGIFRKLITPIIEKCEAENKVIALQTHNPDNLAKYQHFGFEIMEEKFSKDLNLTCYNLLRK